MSMTGDPIRESAAAAGAHRSTPVLVLVARVDGTVLRITLIGTVSSEQDRLLLDNLIEIF
jgi:hypothetical protein